MAGRINELADEAVRVLSDKALSARVVMGQRPRKTFYVAAADPPTRGRLLWFDQDHLAEINRAFGGGILYMGGSQFRLSPDLKKVAKRLAERRQSGGGLGG